MKYFIVFFFIVIATTSRGQITLEHTYPFQLIQFVLVDSDEVKYFRITSDTSVDVFNADHSLYKTIRIPKPSSGDGLYKVQYLSRHLFNTDDKLELLCQSNARNTRVVNEDGQILFERDTCVPNYPLETGSGAVSESIVNTALGTKMFLTDLNAGTTLVFSLPGKLPGGSTTKSSVDPPSIVSDNPLPTSAYPNPSNGQMRISYKLPLGESTGELIILTSDGVELKRYKVGDSFNDVLVEKSDLSSGSYFYKLVTAKEESEVKRLVIIH
ncbi:MAG: T9SS type A sorting domain-containing protein [Candidatus Kapaibacterium sp.]